MKGSHMQMTIISFEASEYNALGQRLFSTP